VKAAANGQKSHKKDNEEEKSDYQKVDYKEKSGKT
jgi:hypothetical protein